MRGATEQKWDSQSLTGQETGKAELASPTYQNSPETMALTALIPWRMFITALNLSNGRGTKKFFKFVFQL